VRERPSKRGRGGAIEREEKEERGEGERGGREGGREDQEPFP